MEVAMVATVLGHSQLSHEINLCGSRIPMICSNGMKTVIPS
jgi:hypothetical protein